MLRQLRHNDTAIGASASVFCSLIAIFACLGQQSAQASADQIVKISAKRFAYSPDQVTVKKNIPVILQLTSTDRSHGIAIPALNLRSDIPAGKVTELRFTPQKSGDYRFYCDVFCGDGHDGMEGKIKVVD